MSGSYKLTIPKSRGELADLLGWLALAGPDFEGGIPGHDIDAAFDELIGGIDNVAAELSPEAESDLRGGAKTVRAAFESGDLKAGITELERLIAILEPPIRN